MEAPQLHGQLVESRRRLTMAVFRSCVGRKGVVLSHVRCSHTCTVSATSLQMPSAQCGGCPGYAGLVSVSWA